MTQPTVSVCVATCNHGRYLESCLSSVLAQAGDLSVEVLVGDDESADDTPHIVRRLAAKHPDAITYIRHEPRIGGTENYLYLIGRARGTYIAHLDGDDQWLPGKLAEQVHFLISNADCAAVYTNAFCVSEDGRPLGTFNNPQPESFDLDALLRGGNFLNHSSLLYRASLKHELLGMPPPFLDYRIALRLARHGRIGYLNGALTIYRSASSTSVTTHANEVVRTCYWESICDVPRHLCSPHALAACMAEFMRAILLRSLRERSLAPVTVWWPRILAATPTSRAHLGWLACLSILRAAVYELRGLVSRFLRGDSLRVRYRR